jgi:L-amino acid N-acyltransferase YncA
VTGFPVFERLRDGAEITIRPMVRGDVDGLHALFRNVPEHDRLFLKEDVANREVIRSWADTLNYRRVLPLLALQGNLVVGDATLHRSRMPALAHVGHVRVVVAEEARGKGVGRALLQHLVRVARREDQELERITFEVVEDAEPAAIRTAEALGFQRAATFANHVRYFDGTPHDLAVMELVLKERPEPELDDPAYLFNY